MTNGQGNSKLFLLQNSTFQFDFQILCVMESEVAHTGVFMGFQELFSGSLNLEKGPKFVSPKNQQNHRITYRGSDFKYEQNKRLFALLLTSRHLQRRSVDPRGGG